MIETVGNMEGYCRGCLLQFLEPTDLITYTEKNRRLFVYSTGIQVKRNDTFTFQLCKECYFNMKQSCKFKKQCRTSEKTFKNYLAKEDAGDFESFLKNKDGNVSFRLPFTSAYSTPAHRTNGDDDNESTCTSIRNFMTDILEGEEIPPTEARIIREVIEEEADVLDDSLDSHWLEDDPSVSSDFDGVFVMTPFGTPRSARYNECYTPRSINEAKQQQINYLTSKEIIEKINKPRISQKFDMPLLESMDLDVEESISVNRTEIHEFNKEDDIAIKFDAPNLHEFDNSIPSEVEDMVTENSMSNTTGCFKIDLLKDLAVKKQIDILENDNPSFNTYNKTKTFANADFDNTTASDNDMCVILSQGTTEKKVEVPLTNELEYYVNKAELKKQIISVNDKKDYHCIIDRNLEIALKNEESKEFALDQLIVTPAVSIRSAVSTPTINNILFGAKGVEIKPITSTPINNTLFGEKHDIEKVPKYFPQVGQNIEDFDDDKIDIPLEDYLNDTCNKTDDELKLDAEFGANMVSQQEIAVKKIESNPNDVLEEFLRDAENAEKLNEEMIAELIDPEVLSKGLSDHDVFKRPFTPPSDKYDLENFICRICVKTFPSCRSLKVHVVKTHNYIFPSDDKHRNKTHKSSVRICEVCGKTVKGTSNYHRHLRKHHEKDIELYRCNDCPLFYRTRSRLQLHIMKMHNNKEPVKENNKYLCNICGLRNRDSYNLDIHIKRHLNQPAVTCDMCSREFYTRYQLKEHIRIQHNGEVPYACKYCPKRYKRRDSLNLHMKRHLGDNTFKCEVCKVDFVSKLSLAQHYGTLKCINNRKKMADRKSTEKVSIKYGKGSLKTIKAKMLPAAKEDIGIENAKDIVESVINSPDTENNSESMINSPEMENDAKSMIDSLETENNDKGMINTPETEKGAESLINSPETEKDAESMINAPETEKNAEIMINSPEIKPKRMRKSRYKKSYSINTGQFTELG